MPPLNSVSSDATIAIVDRYHRPGGHWNVAYPFVRLHQPSSFYGVNSRVLGTEAIDAYARFLSRLSEEEADVPAFDRGAPGMAPDAATRLFWFEAGLSVLERGREKVATPGAKTIFDLKLFSS